MRAPSLGEELCARTFSFRSCVSTFLLEGKGCRYLGPESSSRDERIRSLDVLVVPGRFVLAMPDARVICRCRFAEFRDCEAQGIGDRRVELTPRNDRPERSSPSLCPAHPKLTRPRIPSIKSPHLQDRLVFCATRGDGSCINANRPFLLEPAVQLRLRRALPSPRPPLRAARPLHPAHRFLIQRSAAGPVHGESRALRKPPRASPHS